MDIKRRLGFLGGLLFASALAVWAGGTAAEVIDRFWRHYRGAKDAAERATAVEDLAEADGLEGAKALVQAMADKEPLVRTTAAETLGKYQDEAARKWLLTSALKDSKREVRVGVASALGYHLSSAAVPPLINALKDPDWEVRAAAALSLGMIRDKTSLDPVIEVLKSDKDERTRALTCEALSLFGDPKTNEPLAAALKDAGWSVRVGALQALVATKAMATIGDIIEMMDREKDGRLKGDCWQALCKLTGKDLGFNASAWRDWWAVNKEKIIKGSNPEGGGAAGGGAPAGGGGGGSGVSYHGVQTFSKKILFILDLSRSMLESCGLKVSSGPDGRAYSGTTKIAIAKEELTWTINKMDATTKFTIMFYANFHKPNQSREFLVKWWEEKLQEATGANKERARRFIEKMKPSEPPKVIREGDPDYEIDMDMTNLWFALQEAFRIAGMGVNDKNYAPAVDTIFVLSDGLPTAGEITDGEQIIRGLRAMNKLKKITIHTVVVGQDSKNSQFMKRLATENGGQFVDLHK
ncbi:MAG: HEAT repeat domain-containing protein [Planctomycetes bacterium]|nr:HEAT repeat domain-containing protein [Planctomycetota bacterium]